MLREFLTPDTEIQKRISSLQYRLQSAGIDGAVILQNADLYYFTGTLVQGFLFVPNEGKASFFIKKNYDRAERESPIEGKYKISGISHGCTILEKEIGFRPGILGLELDVIPVNLYLLFKKIFPDCRIIDVSNQIKDCRKLKSDYEISLMREAARISKSAFDKIPSLIEEGMAEIELSALIEYLIRKSGHQGLIRTRTFNMEFYFGPVVSGTSANYPISFDGPVGAVGLYPAVTQNAGSKKISKGEPIMVDFVSGYNGYQVDMARVFAIESVPDKILTAQDFIINKLVPECENMIKPGTSGKDIYNKALQISDETGHSENFMGFKDNKVIFIGHGIGLELDEIPIISGKIDVVLEPGMTFAFEPKIFISGIGGAGVENTYLVTDNGFENLTDFTDNIVII